MNTLPSDRNSLIHSLNSRLEQVPEAQRQVGRYMLQHFSQVPFMTTNELAQAAGTSQASVTRFVSALGFGSYAELCQALSKILITELKGQDGITGAERQWSSDLEHTLQSEVAHLNSLSQVAASVAFKHCARRLSQAPQVLIVGFALGAMVAQHTGLLLHRQRPRVTTLTALEAPDLMYLLHLPSGSFVLLYALSRYPKQTLQLAQTLRKRGMEIGLVTDHVGGKLNSYANHLLITPVTHGLTTAFFAAATTLSGLLVDAAHRHQPGRTAKNLDDFEHLVEKLDYFPEEGQMPWKLNRPLTPNRKRSSR